MLDSVVFTFIALFFNFVFMCVGMFATSSGRFWRLLSVVAADIILAVAGGSHGGGGSFSGGRC